MNASLLQDLARFPSVRTLSLDARGVTIDLHSVLGYPMIHHVIPLSEPERVGAGFVAEGELDGMAVRVTAGVMQS